MTKIITLLTATICCFTTSFSQKIQVTGKIQDEAGNLPIKNVVVMILSEKDSILQSFTRTDENGEYTLNVETQGNKILIITNPLYADYVDNISLKESPKKISAIKLTNKSKLLQAIIIKTGGAIKIKGDTTIYTADSFNVSANANVEELLKKLPGIQVDKNGEIKAMGEKVQKVLVDGEEFFGDDPGMAVKNLRADAVKEVQVFDKKSEQAAFTGIDDGNTQKTINLKLKDDKRKGYFGKISLSGGTGKEITNRFNNNFLFGSFKGKRKIAAFILNGNTGQDGLNWQESQKYGTSENSNFEMWDEDGIFALGVGTNNSDEEVNINAENGFLRNLNSGIQYSNKWKDKHNLNFSPKYNEQDYSNIKTVKNINQFGDSALVENYTTTSLIKRYNLKNTLIYDVNIDSSNSLKVTLRENYFHSENKDFTTSQTNGYSEKLINSSTKKINNNYDKNIAAGNLILKHKFKKERRTLSLNADWNYLTIESENFLYSFNNTFLSNISDTTNIDQVTKGQKSTSTISTKLVYTEPLSKKWSLELSYELSSNQGNNKQHTYNKSNTTNSYDNFNDSLSNHFKQNIIVQKPSAKFNYAFKKFKFNFGSGFGVTQYDLLDLSIGKDYSRNYINLFPTATFVYAYKGNHSLRIKYNGYNTQPTLNQLQPLKNNADIFNQYIGNPDLKPSFANNININHNGYNFLKELWNYQSLNVTFTNNAITDSKIIDPSTGSTITQPVNTNGNININLWTGVGFKIKKTKIDFEISPNGNFSSFNDLINGVSSSSKTISAGINLGLRKSMTDKYDFSINNDFNYNRNTNAQTNASNSFKTNRLTLNGTVYYKKVWSISSDYDFNAREKLAGETANLNVNLVNIKLQKTFNNKEFTVYAQARDLFNQNAGIDRSYYGNNFSEERNQRLKRYFMIGFSWDFKNKNNKK